jgi:hypothetical protein
MALNTINVPIGPAKVEFGTTSPTIFDITKGGIVFTASTSKQDITVDQYGDAPVKSIMKGRTCQVTVPFALHDLTKLAKVIPNSTLVTDAVTPTKKKLEVKSSSGFDLLSIADKIVIKPTDAASTANDWITIPIAGATADPEYTFDSDNERIVNITFIGYPDTNGLLYILGDATATA